MSEGILHYGMPKTGSSSIQTWLLRDLGDTRFHYLNLGRRGSGNLLVTAFLRDPTRHHRNRKRGVDAGQLQQEIAEYRLLLQQQLAALDGRTAIFSAELLASISREELADIIAALGDWCPKLRAVGYVRSPVSFMESVYQQRLKAGNPALQLRALYPGYRERFAKFEQLLTRERVEYWLFEPGTFPEGCVVRDFCSRIGIRFGENSPPRVNDSLSLEAIRLLYAYRRFGPGYGEGEQAMIENRDLREELMQLPGAKLRLHAAAVAPLLAQRRDDVLWMEERLGRSFTETPCEDPGAVRSEEDLLRFSAASLDWLGAALERAPLRPDAAPERVAEEVHRLRLKRASARAETGASNRRSVLGRLWRRRDS